MEIKNAIGDNSPGDYEYKVGEDLEAIRTKEVKQELLRELIDES